jgi:hypothetical protein
LIDSKIQKLGIIPGVVILRMKNRAAGLKRVAGDGDSSHPTTNDGMALEYSDLSKSVRSGVLAEEVRDGGAGYAASDNADRRRF